MTTSADLVLIGGGGFGREVVDVVAAINAQSRTWELRGVVDDALSDDNATRLRRLGVPFLGDLNWYAASAKTSSFVVTIGSPSARRDVVDRLRSSVHRPAILVDPAATVGRAVELGEGTIICPGARVTTNIRLGKHVHVNPNATIGHDSILGSYVSLNPACSVSGDCRIGQESLVGAGAVVLNQVTVGDRVTIGASACVVRDVPDDSIVKGVPAR